MNYEHEGYYTPRDLLYCEMPTGSGTISLSLPNLTSEEILRHVIIYFENASHNVVLWGIKNCLNP